MSAVKKSSKSKEAFSLFDKIKSYFISLKGGSAAGYLKPALVIVALILVASIIIPKFIPEGGPNYLMYVKNGELYYSNVSSIKNNSVTSNQTNYEQNAMISEDGKLIFYKDNMNTSLLYKKTNGLNKKPKKLSDEVFEFTINQSGSVACYIKGQDRELYYHNVKASAVFVDKNVVFFHLSPDGNNLLYSKHNGTCFELWYYESGKNAKLIVSEYDAVYNVSEECNSLIYTKDSSAFMFSAGNDSKLLTENCSEIVAAYDSGEFYYCHYSSQSMPALYYFNGKESFLVTENYSGNINYSAKTPVLIYYANDAEDNKVVSVAVKEKSNQLDFNIDSAYTDAVGDHIYFIADKDSNSQMGILYKAKISGKSVRKAKEVDKDVYTGKFVADGEFIYFKNVNLSDRTADLYLNGSRVDKVVNTDTVVYNPVDDSLIYFKNIQGISGELHIRDGLSRKKVDESVHIGQVFITMGGDLLYLKDFNSSDGVGTLCLCKNTKGKKVADGVTSIYKYETSFSKYAGINNYT